MQVGIFLRKNNRRPYSHASGLMEAENTSFGEVAKMCLSARLKQTVATNEHPGSDAVKRTEERKRHKGSRKANKLPV